MSSAARLHRGARVAVLGVLVALVSSVGLAAPARAAADDGTGSSAPALRWTSCGAELECATLTVPVDAANPTGPTVGLAVIRQPARRPAERVGALVIDPGGPGGSGVAYLRDALWSMNPTVRDRFDVVAFDPRGTGASDAVDCRFDMGRYYSLDGAPRDAAGWDALVAVSGDYAAACGRAAGAWLGAIGTDETVHDLDRLRQALGERRLTYLGYSYGTLIGARYAAAYPERVRALVLDGPIDPDLDPAQAQLDQAVGFETVLHHFFRWCDRRGCSVAGRGGRSTAAALDALDATIHRDGLKVAGTDRRLSSTEVQIGIAAALYAGRAGFPVLERALRLARRGDGAGLAELSDAYTERAPSGSYGTLQDAFFAISCLDGPPTGSIADVRALYDRAVAAAPRLGPGIVSNALVCAQWPVPARPATPLVVPPGLGILVVGTTRDPATPYSGAEALARELDAPLLTVAGDAHTAFDSGDSCVDDRVVAFLLSGRRPAHDERCG